MKTEGCLEGGFTGAASPAVDNRGNVSHNGLCLEKEREGAQPVVWRGAGWQFPCFQTLQQAETSQVPFEGHQLCVDIARPPGHTGHQEGAAIAVPPWEASTKLQRMRIMNWCETTGAGRWRRRPGRAPCCATHLLWGVGRRRGR